MGEGRWCCQGDRSSLEREQSLGKVWSSKVRRPAPKGTVQGRWQGIWGLPLKPAASQGSELIATGHSVGGQQRFGTAKLIQCQCPSRESEVCRESLTSQEAMPVKPSGSLSTLFLETQPVATVCPLISYLGKILPLENTEYRFGEFL